MKKIIALATVVIVSFSAQSSICGVGACKVTFAGIHNADKPVLLLEDKAPMHKSSMNRLFDDVNSPTRRIRTEVKNSPRSNAGPASKLPDAWGGYPYKRLAVYAV